MLHFACHGRTDLPARKSRLDLGTGRTLPVREILHEARNRQSQQDAGTGSCGLVVIPSCPPAATDVDYDQALTLASALLSAGAIGVVTAAWTTSERATALLMSAFHRYLSTGLDPALALRHAQLWMLDPQRAATQGMPAELMADGPDLARPAAWAAFSYEGR
jgi:CHAT domain-containing protein